jgi:hypothetical protein
MLCWASFWYILSLAHVHAFTEQPRGCLSATGNVDCIVTCDGWADCNARVLGLQSTNSGRLKVICQNGPYACNSIDIKQTGSNGDYYVCCDGQTQGLHNCNSVLLQGWRQFLECRNSGCNAVDGGIRTSTACAASFDPPPPPPPDTTPDTTPPPTTPPPPPDTTPDTTPPPPDTTPPNYTPPPEEVVTTGNPPQEDVLIPGPEAKGEFPWWLLLFLLPCLLCLLWFLWPLCCGSGGDDTPDSQLTASLLPAQETVAGAPATIMPVTADDSGRPGAVQKRNWSKVDASNYIWARSGGGAAPLVTQWGELGATAAAPGAIAVMEEDENSIAPGISGSSSASGSIERSGSLEFYQPSCCGLCCEKLQSSCTSCWGSMINLYATLAAMRPGSRLKTSKNAYE